MYEHAAVQDQDDVREDTPTTQSAAVQSSKIQHMPSDDSSALASSSSAALPLPSSRVDAIAEARRYRKRAQAAEQSLETLKQELAAREQELAMQSQRLADLERQRAIDDALLAANAVDLEAARILAERLLAEMEQPHVETAVSDLQRRKPYLFQRSLVQRGIGAMAPRHDAEQAASHERTLTQAASEAASTGKRADLLRYLRLRRSARK